jgi:hypothetical protein
MAATIATATAVAHKKRTFVQEHRRPAAVAQLSLHLQQAVGGQGLGGCVLHSAVACSGGGGDWVGSSGEQWAAAWGGQFSMEQRTDRVVKKIKKQINK